MELPPISDVDSHAASATIIAIDPQLVQGSTSAKAPQKSNEPSSLASSMPQAETVKELTLNIKWAGKEYGVRVCMEDSVGELKRRICEATSVLPKRQKLIGLNAKGKIAEDSMILGRLALKANAKIMMVGSVPATCQSRFCMLCSPGPSKVMSSINVIQWPSSHPPFALRLLSKSSLPIRTDRLSPTFW